MKNTTSPRAILIVQYRADSSCLKFTACAWTHNIDGQCLPRIFNAATAAGSASAVGDGDFEGEFEPVPAEGPGQHGDGSSSGRVGLVLKHNDLSTVERTLLRIYDMKQQGGVDTLALDTIRLYSAQKLARSPTWPACNM